jgi:hypothetical protein
MGKQSRKKRERRQPASPPPVDERKAFSGRQRLVVFGSIGAGALMVIAAVAVVLVAVFFGGSSTSQAELQRQAVAKLKAVGCTYKVLKDLGDESLSAVSKLPKYNSYPPTSGPMDTIGVVWGAYEEPVPQAALLNNLAKGGIAVQYGQKASNQTVTDLTAFWQESPNATVLAPAMFLGKKIALTTWTHLVVCPRFDAGAFKAYRDAFRYQFGPSAAIYAQAREALEPGLSG